MSKWAFCICPKDKDHGDRLKPKDQDGKHV